MIGESTLRAVGSIMADSVSEVSGIVSAPHRRSVREDLRASSGNYLVSMGFIRADTVSERVSVLSASFEGRFMKNSKKPNVLFSPHTPLSGGNINFSNTESGGLHGLQPLRPPKKKNRREQAVIDRYSGLGYSVLAKGWPDLLIFNDEAIFAVEVKRKQRGLTAKRGLSRHQAQIHALLRRAGIEVRVEYVEWAQPGSEGL